MSEIKVIVIEDHNLTRMGLRAALISNNEWRQRLYQQRVFGLVDVNQVESIENNNLNEWLENILERGWQSLNSILDSNSEVKTAYSVIMAAIKVTLLFALDAMESGERSQEKILPMVTLRQRVSSCN